MKQYIFRYLMILAVLLGFLISCDDYLDETDPNMLSSVTYWRDLKDTKAGLNATYAALMNHYIINVTSESCRADMGWPGFGRPSPNGKGPIEWYYHMYTNTTQEVERKWMALYAGVFRANQVIHGLKSIEEDIFAEDNFVKEDDWTKQMAQARFLRGLFYFYLYESFNEGSVILRKDVPENMDDFNQGLSPASEVLDFFREDLLYAYNNLPPKYSDRIDQGRVTAGAAATLLGNSYLYEAEYDSAMFYFDDVINNKEYGYSLVQKTDLMFTLANELNEESILEICYNTQFNPELNPWDENSMHNRWAQFTTNTQGAFTPAWMCNLYNTEDIDTLDQRNYYTTKGNPTEQLKRPVPLRASAMVTLVNDDYSEYYGGSTAENGSYSWNGWGFGTTKKYTNHDLESEEDSGNASINSGKNVTLNRLAEVYINMAECIIKTDGKLEHALKYINDIRSRWGLILLGQSNGDISHTYDEKTYTKEELMEHIMYVEKPLELSNEGHMIRWIDMRRWGITAERFRDLSNQTYYAVTHSIVDSEGKTRFKNRSLVVSKENIPDEYINDDRKYKQHVHEIDYEYRLAVQNYNPAVHDYFEIPSNETIANSGL